METGEVLNDLVKMNNDRIKGYEAGRQGLQETDEDLRSLFLTMIAESRKYKMALATEIAAMGIDIETGTSTSGNIYRGWADVKALFAGHDRQTVLNNCETSENAAQHAYGMALELEMPANIRALISEQKANLKVSYEKIKNLRGT